MPTTLYSERRNVLDGITYRVQNAKNALAQAKSSINRSKADLDSIPTDLKPFIDDIAQAASANPENPAYTTMQGEAVILLNDCASISQTADQMFKAIDAIG